MKKLPEKISLFDIDVMNATQNEILEYLLERLKKPGESYYIVTPNPEIIVYAGKHPQFKLILNEARIGLPDGMGVILAGLILGKPFKERITGVDFMEKLCQTVAISNMESNEKPISIGFLGGRAGIAEETAECLKKKYPSLSVVFAAQEWGGKGLQVYKRDKMCDLRFKNTNKLVNRKSSFINLPQIDILFVAFGFPKQEEWMAEHLGKIPVKVMMGVGGAFDYISGTVSRAPFVMRLFGFEWLYRLIRQPWRIRRQVSLLQFVLMVVKERLHPG